ncbi:MAG TPA: hypothetical protein VIE63_13780 [Ramlibacter sp.]|jgi:hypothetical protein
MRTTVLVGASLALASALMTLPSISRADPNDYVHTPIVQYGEREIDFKAGTSKLRDGTSDSAQSLGLGYGVTQRWFTEFYAKWHQTPDEGKGFDAWEWENLFQLTETGKYPVDVGVLLEIERPKDRSAGYELSWGPLFQMDVTNKVQANLNFLWTKHVRAEAAGPAELGYQWQLKYRLRPEFEFGAQGFGGVGPWDHWAPGSEQSHVAGPAIFGKFKVGQRQVINYNAAVLFGLNNGAPRNTLRVQAEYEF